MADDRPIPERVATMEGQWSATIPELQRRLGVLEANDAEILQEVTATKTEVEQIKTMLQNNGFGKKDSDLSTDLKVKTSETKMSRWITGLLLTIVFGLIAVVIVLTRN